MGRRKETKGGKMPAVVWIVGALVILAIIAFPTWLLYTSTWLPRAKTREFLAVLETGDIGRVRERISPDTRGSSTDATVLTWIEAAKGHEDVDWGSKSKMTSTRGGRTLVSTQGYLRYPGTPKERWFNISLIEDEGQWYVAAFSVGALEQPR
jgi:hypothetical protein